MTSTLTDDLYAKLVNEEDARVCRDISETACREVPGNFFTLVVSYLLTKLGDAVANPKTTLTWLMASLGAPVALTGFLVPVRESGSLIPQLIIAAVVRRQPVRKWVWVVGSLVQGLAVLAMAATAWFLEGTAAGVGVVSALAVFSLARGLCSVAAKDVLGKTIPKTRRGRVGGYSASAAGLATLLVGGGLVAFGVDDASRVTFLVLLSSAALLWIAAAVLYARIVEVAGETEGGANALSEAVGKLSILASDRAFRRFVIARSLLLCSALAAPYFVVLAREHTAGLNGQLGLFIVAGGVASALSAPIWGRLSDRSSRSVMAGGAALTSSLAVVVVAAEWFAPTMVARQWFYPTIYCLLMVAHSGVRLGRKTYVVDLASGNRRTDYVSVSNTVIGVVLLLLGGMGAVAQLVSVPVVVLILGTLGAVGAAVSWSLPETT